MMDYFIAENFCLLRHVVKDSLLIRKTSQNNGEINLYSLFCDVFDSGFAYFFGLPVKTSSIIPYSMAS